MNYKARLRIPTEMYAYVEVDVEGEPHDIVSAYHEFTRLVKPQEGLPVKDFNAFIDRQLNNEENHLEVWEKMSDQQKFIVNEIKKAIKRIEAKHANN